MPTPCDRSDAGPNPTGVGTYYAPDELPWSYFADIANNATRCAAHVLPLAQMTTDLASAATTPNYVWFEADDCDDMEQCGIGAGDTWLSQTVPTILNSPAFRNGRSALFITFDEDNNNKSFNEDNQLQVVPMIVIPSPKSEMLHGRVRTGAYYTHYGLLRTIQLALGLPANLTPNDTFATPLNDFWPAVPTISNLTVTQRHGRIVIRYRDSAVSKTSIAFDRGRHAAATLVHRDHAGVNRVTVPARIARRLHGRYEVKVTAANAAAVTGAPATTRLALPG